MFVPWVGNTPWAHFGASALAGVASALVSMPVDVVKSRMMNSAGRDAATGDVARRRSNLVTVGLDLVRNEGLRAAYAGFIPTCARKVVWCITFFVSYEWLLPRVSTSLGAVKA